MRQFEKTLLIGLLGMSVAACGQGAKKDEPKPSTPTEAKKEPAPTPTPAPTPAPAPAPAAAPEVVATLKPVEAGPPNEEGASNNKVVLTIKETGKPDVTQEFGPHLNCQDQKPEEPKDALAGIYCYWAGAGDQYVLLRAGDALVLQQIPMDEEMEGKPVPQEKFKHPLPAGVALKVNP